MGMDASGLLAYGIDFKDKDPDFLGDYEGSLEQWAEEENAEIFEVVPYGWLGENTILAVKGFSYSTTYGTEEIKTFVVDPTAEEAFKNVLISAGYENPQPKWILAVEASV